jgi:hypothetical protein
MAVETYEHSFKFPKRSTNHKKIMHRLYSTCTVVPALCGILMSHILSVQANTQLFLNPTMCHLPIRCFAVLLSNILHSFVSFLLLSNMLSPSCSIFCDPPVAILRSSWPKHIKQSSRAIFVSWHRHCRVIGAQLLPGQWSMGWRDTAPRTCVKMLTGTSASKEGIPRS